MNCYRCMCEGVGTMSPAVGICRRCGAGICSHHLIEVSSKPVGGMVTMAGQRLLLCTICGQERNGIVISQSIDLGQEERGVSASPWWSRWFTRRGQYTLPETDAVLAEVERLLKDGQPPHKG